MAATVTATSWQLSGEYLETCNCDYVCPCILTNMAGAPTHGHCDFAMAFHIDRGRHGEQALDGLNFALIGQTPGAMGLGNGAFGVVLDERASPEQREALTAILTGQAGGPVAALAPLLTTFWGTEVRPIHFERNGLSGSVSIPGLLDQALEGVPSAVSPGEPLYIENTVHPANARLALAKAVRSHLSVFGRTWDDDSGRNNGHFAPFTWSGA